MDINYRHYSQNLKNWKKKLDELDYMIIRIKETELLVKYGLAEQSTLDELEQKYIQAIKDKEKVRERVRKYEEELKSKN